MSGDKKRLLGPKFSETMNDFSPPKDPLAEVTRSSQTRGAFKQPTKDVSFSSFSRAIRAGDSKIIDKALDLAPIRVDFRDMMTGTSVLHIAARYSHGSLVKLLRHSHIKTLIDAADNRGATPLIVAVVYGNLDAVRSLLQNGAKTRNHHHESGQTALHIASTLQDESILEEILEYNDSSCFLDWFDKSGNTALLTSAEFDTKCSESLLIAGANHLVKNRQTERNILHLAVLYQRRNLIKLLVTVYPEIPFITTLDANGDSPLKLALELKDAESAMILLKSIAGKKLVAELSDSLIMALKIGKEELFNLVLELSSTEHVSSYCNDEGESTLVIAARGGRVELVEKLIQRGVKPVIQKNSCSKKIFDVIETLNNVRMTKTLLDAYIKELDEASQENKNALREIIIRKSPVETFIVIQQSGLFNQIDEVFDSPLYLAAQMGNYGALLFLLLSPACSQRDWVSFTSQSQNDLHRLYLKGEIYASDIYLLTGILPDNVTLKSCPSQAHLFRHSKDHRNIFHACALGGCLNTVIFVYKYCQIFHPHECQKLDMPDETGSTPLLLSIRSKNEDVAVFLIQKGGNLIKTCSSGENSIEALTKHIPDHKGLLMNVMTQCIVKERKWKEGPKNHINLAFHLYILCPLYVNNVTDVGVEICKLDYFKYQDVLCHPLLDYFVWYLWQKVGPLMRVRFYIGAVSTALFSMYVTVKYSYIPILKTSLLETPLWWLSLWLAKLTLCFHLPIFYIRARFVRRLMLMSTVFVPLLEMIYLLFFNASDRTSLEIGGTAILASWLNLLFHGVATPNDGVEIMTIWMVFQEMCFAVPTFFIVTFAFTLYLFTLFNQILMYNNPLHAFLFTAYHMHQGSVVVPSFLYHKQNDEIDTSVNTTDYGSPNVTDLANEPIAMRTELRTMLVEGLTVLFYMLVASALTNMLTTVAIREGKKHLMAKQSKTIARRMNRIREWEIFVNGKFHAFLSQCKALWIVGVQPDMKEAFVVPKVLHPLKTANGFDMLKMKKFLTENEDLISNKEIPYLLKVLERETIIHKDDYPDQ